MARIDCGTHHYSVKETAEEIDSFVYVAGRLPIVPVTLRQTGQKIRVNLAFVQVYHDDVS